MEAVRHIALGCCVVSTVAGLLRVFWPENSFKPVINAVLLLYIITAVWQPLGTADWHGLAAQLRGLTGAAEIDYSPYAQALAGQASAEAVGQVLAREGIQAAVSLQNGICRVVLVRPADKTRALQLLQTVCGTMPYEVMTGGKAP